MALRDPQNSGEHIDDIVFGTICSIHGAEKGTPCFHIYYDDGKGTKAPAVCGPRIRKAGFNGEINPISLSRSSSNRDSQLRR